MVKTTSTFGVVKVLSWLSVTVHLNVFLTVIGKSVVRALDRSMPEKLNVGEADVVDEIVILLVMFDGILCPSKPE